MPSVKHPWPKDPGSEFITVGLAIQSIIRKGVIVETNTSFVCRLQRIPSLQRGDVESSIKPGDDIIFRAGGNKGIIQGVPLTPKANQPHLDKSDSLVAVILHSKLGNEFFQRLKED